MKLGVGFNLKDIMPIVKKIKALNKKGLKRNKKVLGAIGGAFKKANKVRKKVVSGIKKRIK